MLQVAKKEEIDAYFASPALGQSSLKKLLGNVSDFTKEFDSKGEHFVIGSAVDCILTGEEGEFEKTYYTSELEKRPSDAIADIIRSVFALVQTDYIEYLEVTAPATFQNGHFEVVQDDLDGQNPVTSLIDFAGSLGNWRPYVLQIVAEVGWNSKWGDDAKFNNIIVFNEFFMDLCKAYGKIILDSTQKATIDSIVNSLRTHRRTARFFDREQFASWGEQVQVFYQFPIYFEYRGVECKALLDMVIVERDIEGGIVSVQGIDFKTMNGNTYHFLSSVKSYGYHIQAAWYMLALELYFAVSPAKIKNFLFVVESTTTQGKPLVIKLNDDVILIGRHGRKAVSIVDTDMFNTDALNAQIMRPILGLEALLDMYLYHKENGFDEEKEIKELDPETPLTLSWEGYVTL